MSDQEAQVQTQETEPTLEDVYKDAGIEVTPHVETQVQQQPQVTQTQVEPFIPDPYDVDKFKAYIAEQQRGTAATQDAIRQLAGYVNQQRMAQAQAELQADLNKAVETVNQVLNHPKPKVVEAMIDAKAREDVRFKQLWENRSKNPTAWNNALNVVAKEFAKDLQVKVDPDLVASQRARKIAQQQMATTDAPRSESEEWESMSLEEQQARYDRILNGTL